MIDRLHAFVFATNKNCAHVVNLQYEKTHAKTLEKCERVEKAFLGMDWNVAECQVW